MPVGLFPNGSTNQIRIGCNIASYPEWSTFCVPSNAAEIDGLSANKLAFEFNPITS
jgi:hypothetical protein